MVDGLMLRPEIVHHIAHHLRRLPDLERLLGRIKITLQSSGPLLLPLFRRKVLNQRVSSADFCVLNLDIVGLPMSDILNLSFIVSFFEGLMSFSVRL